MPVSPASGERDCCALYSPTQQPGESNPADPRPRRRGRARRRRARGRRSRRSPSISDGMASTSFLRASDRRRGSRSSGSATSAGTCSTLTPENQLGENASAISLPSVPSMRMTTFLKAPLSLERWPCGRMMASSYTRRQPASAGLTPAASSSSRPRMCAIVFAGDHLSRRSGEAAPARLARLRADLSQNVRSIEMWNDTGNLPTRFTYASSTRWRPCACDV